MLPKVFGIFFFSALASANLHTNCHCDNGEAYNWRITADACKTYNDANYKWGGATYDAATGWCTQANSDARIAGKEWEAACRDIAQKGFGCIDGQGKCYADVGDVRGRC
ncbi:hypothetical protein F5X68DRAFT_279591 [Plectosphaerella plurivora]|uniref:Uncharacterized protein n=1 Tax=Plectosphaerella plurivora TaxID=936078 RepID=A0A9P8V1F3_9PEZI|nr:hypothetical protein F5X68DRAFT_279591 [Plectosphaerella plurivora]